ncbi:MAG: hypothetical protein RMK15_08800 [Chloroflexota bacterium]|nr:hypothetical protein [Dehalococcoidia bacterium]MDW8047360.1 hypothetical protein [Chloroflexota bacterium]
MNAELRAAADRLLYDAAHVLRLAEMGGWSSRAEGALRAAAQALAALAPDAPLPENAREAFRSARRRAWERLVELANEGQPPPGGLADALAAVAEAGLSLAAHHPDLARDALALDWLRTLPLPERLEDDRERLLRAARQRRRRLRALR